jgi:hypothetical protein
VARTRSWLQAIPSAIDAAAFALVAELVFAAPPAAQGVVGTGSGRAGATVAAVVALIGVVTGGLALARSAGRTGTAVGRDAAVAALVLGLIGMVLAGLHLATSTGAVGTGNGRGGAIVALALGLVGVVLGRLALARSRRAS